VRDATSREGRPASGAESPPPHAALEYRAHRLCAALDDPRMREVTLAHFPPATAALLHWWCAGAVCRARVDNFNRAQRLAILHVLLAHDLPGGADPALRRRIAVEPANATIAATDARFRLHLAAGSGLRWVLQALLVWRWATDPGRPRLRVQAAGPALQRRLRAAILGDVGDGTDPEASSLLRHARLFLPPSLRAPFRDWLAASAADALQPRATDTPLPGAFRLFAASADGGRLQIDLSVATGGGAATQDRLLDLSPQRAIRLGACKLPVLEAVAPVGAGLRPQARARSGLRPKLSRMQQRLLDAAIAALGARDAAFVALDPARRPRLAVLCATPQLLQAARRRLIAAGLDPAREIATRHDGDVNDDVRVLLDLRRCDAGSSGPPAIVDPRICLVAVLRAQREDPPAAAQAIATGAALLWPEPEFARLRAEDLERVARGQPPRHRIDALSIFDDPGCRSDYAGLPHGVGDGGEIADSDDLFLAPLRADGTAFDLPLPGYGPADGPGPGAAACMSALPQRILRRRQAMAVARASHGHAPCDVHDSGLRRAFLECAEADPAIECHGLPDPRRHQAPGREALLARGADGRGWPDALVRTARHLYLVEFLPCAPLQETPASAAERALHDWLCAANARAAQDPGARLWRRVALPAPSFWSWKRRGDALSALLEALAASE
jgi:hypothetical protein